MYANAKELFEKEYVSYTRLAAYDKCPHSFFLKYVKKYPSRPLRITDLGKIVHEVIAEFLRDFKEGGILKIEPNMSILSRYIKPAIANLKKREEIEYSFAESELIPYLNNFCSMMPVIDSRALQGIEVEKNFKINGIKYKCILDLLLCDKNGNYTVVDFKIGKPEYVDDLQLKTYALPLFANRSVPPVKLVYAFLSLKKTEFCIFSYEEAMEHVNYLNRMTNQIIADKVFKPKKSFLCKYCGVRSHCDYFALRRKMFKGW